MDPDCADWKAWHDRMPGVTPTLHVTATCTFPTTGYSVELRPEQQGANDKDYLLRLMVHEPTGPVNPIVTPVQLHYREETDYPYETVSIRPDGPAGIRVDPVS